MPAAAAVAAPLGPKPLEVLLDSSAAEMFPQPGFDPQS
jgi:hypothetical protein